MRSRVVGTVSCPLAPTFHSRLSLFHPPIFLPPRDTQVEAQDRARRDALSAMYARQDKLMSISDDRKRAAAAADAEEKERTLREFQEARIRIAAAERAEAEKRRATERAVADTLAAQVEERRHREDADKERAREMQRVLGERAAEATRSIRDAKARDFAARQEYNRLLQQQMAAKRRLAGLKKEGARESVLAAVDELEGEGELLDEVSRRLAERAAREEEARRTGEEHRAALEEALRAAGLDPASARGV